MVPDPSSSNPGRGRHPGPDGFLSTRWSVVLDVGARDPLVVREALETLCSTYWYPLYAFLRRRGVDAEEAEDVTQGFFARILERRDLEGLDPARGRLRAFLLASMKHYLANHRDYQRAQKRGGGQGPLSLDMSGADERYGLAAAPALSPERLFERAWALALLERVLARLRTSYEDRDRGALFEELKGTLTGESPVGELAAVGERLGMTEGAVKVAAHRLRERYRKELRAEVAGTLEDPSQVESELQDLFQALGG